MIVSSGLFHCLITNYISPSSEIAVTKRYRFYFAMFYLGIFLFLNNIAIWNIEVFYFSDARLEHLEIINFICGIFFPFIALAALPTEIGSKLFVLALHRRKTYFMLKYLFVFSAFFYPIAVFFGHVNLANNILINLIQLSALTALLHYIHKLSNRMVPLIYYIKSQLFSDHSQTFDVRSKTKDQKDAQDSRALLTYWVSTTMAILLMIVAVPRVLIILGAPTTSIHYLYELNYFYSQWS